MNIVVVGAGPAGLICAWQLAKAGHTVVIYEQHKTLDPRGSGVLLQSVGMSVLDRLGIYDEIEIYGRRVSNIRGYSGFDQRRTVIDADFGLLKRDRNYSLGINRSVLWKILLQKTKEFNVAIKTGVGIEALDYPSSSHCEQVEKISILDGQKNTLGEFDLVIDASGANSKLKKFAINPGCGSFLEYGSLWSKVILPERSPFNSDRMILFTGSKNHGLGLMPTGKIDSDGAETMTLFFNFKYQDGRQIGDHSFDRWRADALKKWACARELIEQIKSPKQLYSARFMHHTMPTPYGEKLVFVGDAAHCSSPQLGQGINMSLIDAVTLCEALASSNELEGALKKYAKARKCHVWIYQTTAKFLTPFYQSDDVFAIFARDHYFRFLFKLKFFRWITATLLSGILSNPLRSLSNS